MFQLTGDIEADLEAFLTMAVRMRELQLKFFKDRDNGTLREAKDAERRFDAAMRLMRDRKFTTPSLFGEGDQ